MKRSKAWMNSQSGHAMAETIMVMLAFIPLFIGVTYLGKELDVKEGAYEAARYAVWERTVWNVSGQRAGVNSNSESAARLAGEVRDRVAGNPRAGLTAPARLTAAGVSSNPLWTHVDGASLLGGETRPASDNVSVRAGSARDPVDIGAILVPAVAYGKHVPSIITKFTGLSGNMLGFSHQSVATGNVQITIDDGIRQWGHTALAQGRVSRRSIPPLRLTAGSALLVNAWNAEGERENERRIDGIVADLGMDAESTLANIIGILPVYKELRYAADDDVIPPTGVTLPEYIHPRR